MSTLYPDTSHAQVDALYRQHHGWLRGWLRQRLNNSADAADLAQDTFIRVLLARTAGSCVNRVITWQPSPAAW